MTYPRGDVLAASPVAPRACGAGLADGDRRAPAGKSAGIRALTRQAARDLVYAAAVCAWAVAGFSILVSGLAVTASLLVLVVGVAVWLGFAYMLRATTWVDRRLAGWQRHQRVASTYRRPDAPGFVPLLKTVTSDPQTWRDMAWLGVTSVVGFAMGLGVMVALGLALTYVTMPFWYWAVSHPEQEYGITNFGVFTVDTVGGALALSAVGLALVPLALVLARAGAAMHAELAVRFLGSSAEGPRTRQPDRAAPAPV